MSNDLIDIKKLICEDPDYINIGNFKYSLEILLKKYPDGCPDHIICTALNLHHSDLSILFKKALKKIEQEL